MPVYLVRHADALSRSEWQQPDDIRPLSKRGLRQAAGLAERLGELDIRRIVSSPSIRCIRTVEPLAQRLGIGVEVADELLEGASAPLAVSFAENLAKRRSGVVVCSHGDVIPDMLRTLGANGLKLHDELKWPKGSTWILDWDGDHFTDARYQAPAG